MKHIPRKRFGQNFLTDQLVLHNIIATINPQADDSMVEIGPGLAAPDDEGIQANPPSVGGESDAGCPIGDPASTGSACHANTGTAASGSTRARAGRSTANGVETGVETGVAAGAGCDADNPSDTD